MIKNAPRHLLARDFICGITGGQQKRERRSERGKPWDSLTRASFHITVLHVSGVTLFQVSVTGTNCDTKALDCRSVETVTAITSHNNIY